MTRESYQAELKRVWSRPKFITSRSNIGDGAQLDAVPIPPSPDPDKYLLGVLLDCSVTVTLGASTNTFKLITTKGGSPLDFFTQRIRVKPDEGAIVRSSAQTRVAIESFEQIACNMSKRTYPFSGKAVAVNASSLPSTNVILPSSANVVKAEVFVPVGGKSCAIEIDVPAFPKIGTGATNAVVSLKPAVTLPTSSSRIINYKALYGSDSTIVTFDSRTTQNLSVNGDNSLLEYQTKNMSPDFVGYRNKVDVTQVLAEGEKEVLINSKTNDFPWLQAATPDLAPTYQIAPKPTPYGAQTDLIWFSVNKKRFSTHVATVANTTDTVSLELYSISWDDGPATSAIPAPAANTPPDYPSKNLAPAANVNTRGMGQYQGRRVS